MCRINRNPTKMFRSQPFGCTKTKGGPWRKWTEVDLSSNTYSFLWEDGQRWTQEEEFDAEPFLPERVDLIHRHLYPECHDPEDQSGDIDPGDRTGAFRND